MVLMQQSDCKKQDVEQEIKVLLIGMTQWRIQGGGTQGTFPPPPPRAVKRSSLGPWAGCSYVTLVSPHI